MDLGPREPIRECPTCGVDAARAMVVSACVAFYHPIFVCARCEEAFESLQAAANHLAEHEPDLVRFVNDWVDTQAASEHLRIVRE